MLICDWCGQAFPDGGNNRKRMNAARTRFTLHQDQCREEQRIKAGLPRGAALFQPIEDDNTPYTTAGVIVY